MSGDRAELLVPGSRLPRWLENFAQRHGTTRLTTTGGALVATAEDGSDAELRLPFDRAHSGAAELGPFLERLSPPSAWGVLLVRKGGFAVARMAGGTQVETKVGHRHVQGRTKAGGQSQQRFSRRRDNQARQAYEAAAEHAVRILRPGPVVLGGDRAATSAVLEDPRLAGLEPTGWFLSVPDPRRSVLDQAVADAGSVQVRVRNA